MIINEIKKDEIELNEIEKYFDYQNKNGVLCCLKHLIYTWSIVVNLKKFGYSHRYCYDSLLLAKQAFNDWDGVGDPKGYIVKK